MRIATQSLHRAAPHRPAVKETAQPLEDSVELQDPARLLELPILQPELQFAIGSLVAAALVGGHPLQGTLFTQSIRQEHSGQFDYRLNTTEDLFIEGGGTLDEAIFESSASLVKGGFRWSEGDRGELLFQLADGGMSIEGAVDSIPVKLQWRSNNDPWDPQWTTTGSLGDQEYEVHTRIFDPRQPKVGFSTQGHLDSSPINREGSLLWNPDGQAALSVKGQTAGQDHSITMRLTLGS